jgi:hypothetical protein
VPTLLVCNCDLKWNETKRSDRERKRLEYFHREREREDVNVCVCVCVLSVPCSQCVNIQYCHVNLTLVAGWGGVKGNICVMMHIIYMYWRGRRRR